MHFPFHKFFNLNCCVAHRDKFPHLCVVACIARIKDNFIAISIKTGIGFGIFNYYKIIRIKQKLPNSSIAKSKIQFPCAKAQTVKAAPLGPKMVKKSETAGRFSKIKTS